MAGNRNTNQSDATSGGARNHATVLLGLLVLAVLAALPGNAAAAEVYVHTITIGAPGAGNGELSLGEHSGIAVNQTSGDVYVADTGNGRVEEFEADGSFVRVFGGVADPTFLSIDNSNGSSNGAVYVGDSVAGTVSKFAADGSAATTWGVGGQLSGFPELTGIAVGGDGNLYVLSANIVSRFDAEGAPAGAPFEATERGSSPLGLAIDLEGNLYKAAGFPEIVKFTNTGASLGEPDTRGDAVALATDPVSGDLYVAHSNGAQPSVSQYALNCGQSCTPLESFGTGELASPQGISTGPGGVRYVTDAGTSTVAVFSLQTVELPTVVMGAVSAVTGTSVHLDGEVDSEGFATNCSFQIVADAQFEESGFASASQVPCAASPGSGSTPVPVEATAEGLLPGNVYHARLVATNPAGTAASSEPNPSFTTHAVPPVVEAQFVPAVGPVGATLGATINPGGATTGYRFEYVDDVSFNLEGFASPATRTTGDLGTLPADNSPHSVTAAISGLEPAAAYRFRVVATNSASESSGPSSEFRTLGSSLLPTQGCVNQLLRTGFGARLPDCRAYEQVTPGDKGGLYIEGFADLIGGADDGSAVSFSSGAGSGFPATGGARQDTTTLLSSLSGDSWSTQRLLPPEQFGSKAGFLGASADMRFALVAAGRPPESGTPTKIGLFLVDTQSEAVTQIAPYQSERAIAGAFAYGAISDDGSRVFFESRAKLTPEAAPGRANLYTWGRGSGLSLAGVLPANEGGSAPPGGSFGGSYAWYVPTTETGGGYADMYVEAVNAASPDGGQIYFTAGETGQLYLRRGLTGPSPATVHVSKPAAGVTDPNGPLPAAFQEAIPDGSRAFFTSSEKLTNDASTGEFDLGTDLYRYDEVGDKLVDITGDQESLQNPNGAEVQGLLGASADGSSGYFAAKGALTAGATAGENNIYRFKEEEGEFALTLVATVGGFVCGINSSGNNWSPSSYCGSVIGNYLGKSARVTPDGEELVFSADGQINMYRSDTGKVICISCSGTGAESAGAPELTAGFVNANQFVTPTVLPAARLTHSVSDDGSRIFFQTPDSLVAEDQNGLPSCKFLIDNPVIGKFRPTCVDVYEWEAPGAPGGSCTKAEINGGCLYLLSSGTSEEASYFLDASRDGRNVFIATTSQLVPVDRDDLYDIYDVHVDGGIASQHVLPEPPCEEEACRGAPANAQLPSTPGSSSFTGPGNPKHHPPKRCHKKSGPRKSGHKGHGGKAGSHKASKRCGGKRHKKHKRNQKQHRHTRSGKGGQK